MPHQPYYRKASQQGFSLLEMGIVLIIIGLIVGGVFVGQSMIRTSQLRSIIGEVDRYVKAIDTFQQKYFSLPGDMVNAESFWGSDTGCPSVAYNEVKKNETCNGDGDGKIGIDASSNQYEWFTAWQQLANAGMVEGLYTGAQGSASAAHAIIGTNVPKSALSNAGYNMMYWSVVAGDADHYPTEPGHVLAFGGATTSSYTTAGVLTPSEALEIDTKIDDTRPAYGKVKAYKPASLNADCTTDVLAASANYKVSKTSPECALMFSTGF